MTPAPGSCAPTTTTHPDPATETTFPGTMTHRRRTGLVPVCVLFTLGAVVGLFAPNPVDGAAGMGGMSMTHYMSLLAARQPWNLLIFMALPVVLVETIAICELAILFSPRTPRWVHSLSRTAGMLAGPVMLAILLCLTQYAVIPLTRDGAWAGWVDVLAVLAYLAGAVPMIGISLIHAGLLGEKTRSARRLHVIFVAAFLVVAHIAMIAGMLDPAVTGWEPAPTHGPTHQMPDGSQMPGMHH